MNKKLVVISAAIAAVLATGTVVAAAQSVGTIGKAKAKEEALRAVNGVVEEIDQEVKRGRMVYEVEVQRPELKDDTTVLIDAHSGELIAVYEDDAPRSSGKTMEQPASIPAVLTNKGDTGSSSVSKGSSSSDKTMLTLEQAKDIALRTVKGTIVDVDLDRDNGVTKYEFDIRTDQGKVELDIHAYSGKVLSQKLDLDDDWDDDDRYEDDRDDWDDDDHYDDDRYDD